MEDMCGGGYQISINQQNFPPTMRPDQFHEPVRMNSHNFQSLINSKWCGNVKKVEIWMDGDGRKWFSAPNIPNF